MVSNPFGLHTITPYLVVRDAAKLIEFCETVFGAELRGDPHLRGDGSIKHAETTIGDSVVMIGEIESPGEGSHSTLYLYVDNCDRVFQEAISHGAKSFREPADYPHGDRYGGIQDPCGNQWWPATHIGKQ